jgi:hypothetical protein
MLWFMEKTEESARQEFERYLSSIEFKRLRVPVIANTTEHGLSGRFDIF